MNTGLIHKPIRSAIEKISTHRVKVTGQEFIIIPVPSQYKHLVLNFSIRSTRAASTQDEVRLRFNGDAGNNYDQENIFAGGTVVGAAENINISYANLSSIPAASSPDGAFGIGSADIIAYNNTDWFKTITSDSWFSKTTGSGNQFNLHYSTFWRSKEVIRDITLSILNGLFVAESFVNLYGVY